jgi:hypothetical protein
MFKGGEHMTETAERVEYLRKTLERHGIDLNKNYVEGADPVQRTHILGSIMSRKMNLTFYETEVLHEALRHYLVTLYHLALQRGE